ncbi:MAG: hypothetical protein AAGI03_10025, partial [Pseudomonadota bacterium]
VGVYMGSLVALSVAYLVANFVLFVPLQIITLRHMRIPVADYLAAIVPTLVSAALMASAIFAVQMVWPGLSDLASWAQLMILVPFGVAVFAGAMYGLFTDFVHTLRDEALALFRRGEQGAPAE